MSDKYIDDNINIHNAVATKYNRMHSEIYNDIEQERISNIVKDIVGTYKNDESFHVLDFGSGTGNLTKHFLENNCHVTAIDVSVKSLDVLKRRFANKSDKLKTCVFSGKNIPFETGTFDAVVTYSVLHHIPDYIFSVEEMCRVTKKGGIILIDHESNEDWRLNNDLLKEYNSIRYNFWRKLIKTIRTGEIFQLSLRKGFFIRMFIDKKYSNEGDIHVHQDDHIEWNEIKKVLEKNNFVVEYEGDYLVYDSIVSKGTWEKYKNHITDTKLLIAKKMRNN